MIPTALLCFAALASAQGPLSSPQVHADRSVTFRLRAPNAAKAELSMEGQAALPMTKAADGVWSVTTKPLTPDIYGYSFAVDGSTVLDPLNPQTKPNLIWPSNLVTVPGTPPEVWEVQDVPRGEVHHHFYRSKLIGDHRDYVVYTPPGYRSGRNRLPVLYLLHGFSDTAIGWTEVGKAHVILDNLIAKGQAKPMVVVMPLGYGVPGFASPGGRAFSDRNLNLENFTKFRAALLTEVMPEVERSYRVSTKREDRAIAGLSMGGAETLFTGLNHPDKFAYVGAFSSGGLPANDPSEVFPDVTGEKTKRIKVLWMACGTGDGLIGFQRGFADWLKTKGVRVETKETPGGHVWMLWRRYLAEFAGKIFR